MTKLFLRSGDFNFGKWRSKEDEYYKRMLCRKFEEAASSPKGRGVRGFPAIADFFRVLMAREDIESYPLLQVCQTFGESKFSLRRTAFRYDDIQYAGETHRNA